MKKLTETHGFELASLAFAVVAVFWWLLAPQAGAWSLAAALIPWAVRIAAGKFPFRRTSFDLPIAIFVLTAGVGVWAAYDQNMAFRKFFLILGAIFVYYALIGQSRENLFGIILGCGVFAGVITILFILSHDWHKFPTDVNILNSIVLRWMDIRPEISFDGFSEFNKTTANIAGGINAFLLPLCSAVVLHFRQQKKKGLIVFALAVTSVLVLGLLFSSSRAAWVAAFIGMGIFVLLNHSATQKIATKKRKVLLAIPLLIFAMGVIMPVFLALTSAGIGTPFTRVSSLTSRLEIAKNTLYLIGDYPFTGGGLASFAGQYSRYILGIPFFIFNYSHNLLLDVAFEQGILGFIAFGLIIFFCTKNIITHIDQLEKSDPKGVLLATSIFSSLIIVLLHGIADDPLYSNAWGLPLLFLLPGFSTAISNQSPNVFHVFSKYRKPPLMGLGVLLVLFVVFYVPITAAWHANIGAVLMAKIGLENWPKNEWLFWKDTQEFEFAQSQFTRAISIDPKHRTANHRLGLIKMAARDFQSARGFLETSHATSPEHRGIQKSLGYCYVWLGEYEAAAQNLKHIPEASEEIRNYTWWWQDHGEDALAARAIEFLHILNDFNSSTK